jgi:hypothetical protein
MRRLALSKKALIPITAGLICIFLIAGTTTVNAGSDKFREMINCDISNASCTQSLGKTDVTLSIKPKPVKAMEDLDFQIALKGATTSLESAPYIDLGMPGMDMGPNRVMMKPSGENSYAGKGIIVRCPSGRTIWQATVTVPGQGTVRFVFDVVY